MPKKASTRRAASKNQATTEEDYERTRKREMALADLANEAEKRMKMINDEAKEIINFLQSTYAHCLSALTKEEKEMLWVDYEARRKPSAVEGSGTSEPGIMAEKVLNDINVKIPDVEAADRKGRRKRPAKARKGDENMETEPSAAIGSAPSADDGKKAGPASPRAAAPHAGAATVSSLRTVAGSAAAVPETPAAGMQFSQLSSLVSQTERRPKPNEKLVLRSEVTGSPVEADRVCVLVDGKDVLPLLSTHDLKYLENIVARLRQQTPL